MACELAHELIHELATCEVGLQFVCKLDNATYSCTAFKNFRSVTCTVHEPSRTVHEAEEACFTKYCICNNYCFRPLIMKPSKNFKRKPVANLLTFTLYFYMLDSIH